MGAAVSVTPVSGGRPPHALQSTEHRCTRVLSPSAHAAGTAQRRSHAAVVAPSLASTVLIRAPEGRDATTPTTTTTTHLSARGTAEDVAPGDSSTTRPLSAARAAAKRPTLAPGPGGRVRPVSASLSLTPAATAPAAGTSEDMVAGIDRLHAEIGERLAATNVDAHAVPAASPFANATTAFADAEEAEAAPTPAVLSDAERKSARRLCYLLCSQALGEEDLMYMLTGVDIDESQQPPAAPVGGGGDGGGSAEDGTAGSLLVDEDLQTRRDSEGGSGPLTRVNSALTSVSNGTYASSATSHASGNYARALANISRSSEDARQSFLRVAKFAKGLFDLTKCWAQVTVGDKAQVLADELLSILFKAKPEYADTIFVVGDQQRQALAVVRMIGMAVASFSNPTEMQELMREVGARHRLYGVQEEHFCAIRVAFMEAYTRLAAPEMATPYHLEMWKMFWDTIVTVLVIASNSERGLLFDDQRRTVFARRVQKVFAVIEARQRGRPQDPRMHYFFYNMFSRAILAEPTLEVLSALREPRESDRAMELILKLVSVGSDMEAFEVIVMEAGARFTGLGLTESVAACLQQPFMDTCKQYIGNDPKLWTRMNIMALKRFWDDCITFIGKGVETTFHKDPAMQYAPDGEEPFCLMLTSIEASTRLWEQDRAVMTEAMKHYHAIIRGLIKDYHGFEVKTVVDSFLIACKTPLIALQIALGTQLELMKHPSATGFRMVPNTQGGGDPACWREDSVRVRIGIHYCTNASAVYDGVYKRFDYYGPSVNCAAHVEAAACGGQILMTKECVDELWKCTEFTEQPRPRGLCGYTEAHRMANGGTTKPLSEFVDFTDLGMKDINGGAEPVHLISALPVTLSGRTFNASSRSGAHYASQSTRTNDSAYMHMPIESVANEVFGGHAEGMRGVTAEES